MYMTYDPIRAQQLLVTGTGRSDANFREGQEDAIRHVVEGRGRLLLVQKTGWGKSSVYFIATKLLREVGAGLVLLISPLLALMRNQIFQAERMGVRAATINSDNQDEWELVEEWPTGGLPHMQLSGRIQSEYQFQQGKALCIWGDAGWGELVRQGKYRDNRFADELVSACTDLVRNWNPEPSPTYITCIPSRRHPNLVSDFAQRLAASLNLPFYSVLEKTDDRPQQKGMANSSQQARNVDGSLAIVVTPLPEGPVLLVDDMVDSRWTMTIATWLLRSHGSGEVFPLALSYAGHDE